MDPADESPTELRLRAIHFRELAEYFEHDEIGSRLRGFADGLEAQARAIERLRDYMTVKPPRADGSSRSGAI